MIRQATLQVIKLILQQGLVHPVQIVPYLVCMATDPDTRVSNAADRELQVKEGDFNKLLAIYCLSGLFATYMSVRNKHV